MSEILDSILNSLPDLDVGEHGHSFGYALDSMRVGNVVARQGQEREWLILIQGWQPAKECGKLIGSMERKPWIAKKSKDGLVPWVPSQDELLAHDWIVCEWPELRSID